ncbi:MAG: hemerythrin domain-containing protein [Rhodanobacteraceae bacterium]
MDITQLILDDHREQRRRFALMDGMERSDHAALEAVWRRLAVFLEVHAAAEERFFYPELLKIGHGAGSKATAAAETKDAICDHNDIRSAVTKVGCEEVGTDKWFAAIADARRANSDHMGEEERESLADFRRHAGLQRSHDLAVAFATFEARHFAGVEADDKDPDRYIGTNS